MNTLSIFRCVSLVIFAAALSVGCGKRGGGGGSGGGAESGSASSVSGNGDEAFSTKEDSSKTDIVEESEVKTEVEQVSGVIKGEAISCSGAKIDPGSLQAYYPAKELNRKFKLLVTNEKDNKKVGFYVLQTSSTTGAESVIAQDSPKYFSLLPGSQRVIEVSYSIPTKKVSSPAIVTLDIQCTKADGTREKRSLGLVAKWW